jgi:manganese oxidase
MDADRPLSRRDGAAGGISRRHFFALAAAGSAAGAGVLVSRRGASTAAISPAGTQPTPSPKSVAAAPGSSGGLATYHCVLNAATLMPRNAGNPDAVLYPPRPLPASPGRLRHFELTVGAQDIEVARDRVLKAWAFNGSVPGPTVRVTQGDVVEVVFHNETSMPHTIHFHGIHPAAVDGITPIVAPGSSFTYRFEAQPYGLFVYHCHMTPLADHINHGMYGVLIIDPPTPRPQAQELVFLMNGYSFAPDGEDKRDNDVYSINGPAGYYACHPIPLQAGKLVRVYVANMTEFDPINSFHLHANVFKQIPSVMALDSTVYDDTVMLCQGQRSILEFQYDQPGLYMTHAHQSDITEKGWAAFLDVS